MGTDVELENHALISQEAGVMHASTEAGDEHLDIGFVPITLPHKNRVRYIILTPDIDRSHQNPQSIYQVIESNHSTLLLGGIAFSAFGPFAAGLGAIGQISKDVNSIRTISGLTSAYLLPELSPPKTLDDVLAWPSQSTSISYHSLRGFKLIAGIYAVAHAGTTFELEGIWSHRVCKENNIISVSLSLKKQYRLKGSIGLPPILFNNADLYHSALSTELTFTFTDISADPEVNAVLQDLLNTQNSSAILQAKKLAEKYALKANEYAIKGQMPPIAFNIEHIRAEKDKRNRFRLRLPLLANAQAIYKKRDREQQTTFHYQGATYQNT
jgi:hypothetical protein